MAEEQFQFTPKAKKRLSILAIVGVVLLILGIFSASSNSHADEASHGEQTEQVAESHGEEAHATEEHAGEEGHGYHWSKRIFANLWINNMYFVGLALLGVFFVAIQYVSQAGWSAALIRIPMSFGNWLPIGGILTLAIFLLGGHDIFHWTHEYLYDVNDPRYDAIIAGKEGYLNTPFFLARMVVYFVVWYLMFRWIQKKSLEEDLNGSSDYYFKLRGISAGFIVFFAVTSSTSAWDWILSVDTHWFSTMFGWYVFASWWVTALAAITLITVILKEQGYLKIVNTGVLHDLGKFVFAFSIFWTYIWFSQFMLIYYSNIPEETVYFIERLSSDHYSIVFFVNLILNFFFPFLVFMPRDSKRHTVFLKIVTIVVLIGHWFDFYLMITPGVLKENGGFGLLEIGMAIIFGVAFLFVALTGLSKKPLIAKNHPMLKEAEHHHVF
ncbi:quinol:cytochrome C oxidoreductase [Marivirga tractuosa]|uniref:Quinol:cytochrome c oxidoreductase quinone-binding subunit 2 n=1 Tax=Marivirga tractuosa (strain ATCC 23168 / DSM 4126 / NBRC 15989 / NCIMB 1408 / VKM B-1430 / H-43) TaxID=643867 RepID=E4TQG5_MARTH|nr:quinol:cytochrome C oxidoreductase [Marivirga tractuosa]ADR23658.1 quinol:cytochrome c oxidoreductase quinone-binding subunit 2 [Marivirga tractuosa DSM 4126]BDD15661.1 quinol:cytochrome C oxidoreductase [Marivirga tractuosa]